jgi:hypothetical protein
MSTRIDLQQDRAPLGSCRVPLARACTSVAFSELLLKCALSVRPRGQSSWVTAACSPPVIVAAQFCTVLATARSLPAPPLAIRRSPRPGIHSRRSPLFCKFNAANSGLHLIGMQPFRIISLVLLECELVCEARVKIKMRQRAHRRSKEF